MMFRWLLRFFGSIALLWASSAGATYFQSPGTPTDANLGGVVSCEALGAKDLMSLSEPVMIVAAERVEADGTLPAYCKLQGIIRPQIQFEIRLPLTTWNGRYYQVGCGGFCGVVNIQNCGPALAANFVVAAQNMGHVGAPTKEPVWGGVPVLREDYGKRSTHIVSVIAKEITQIFYGKAPAFSYFQGCSTGGREGLSEAQHHPDDFDGIIAGDPAFPGRLGTIANNWDARHLLRPDGSEVFSPAKLKLLAGKVMAQCDAIDGLADGIIMDPRRCRYDVATLACASGDGADCLTAEQVRAAKALYEGPVNSAGKALMPGATPFGSELSWSGRGRLALAGGYLRNLAFPTNPATNWNWRNFDFDKDIAAAEASAAMFDPVAPYEAPDLTAFERAGGKLLVYHGWADAGVSPYAMLDYHAQVAARQGGLDRLPAWFRVFMVPGMFHCRGGDAPNSFDTLTPMVAWVEKGIEPDRIVAEQRQDGKLIRSRPLFPYPQQARFDGKGDADEAASWTAFTPEGRIDDRRDWLWAPKQ